MRGLTLLLMLVLLSTFTHAQPAAPEPVLTLGRGEIVSAAWAPDGQSIWIGTTAGTWQLDTALREIAAYPHITYAALSPDGTYLAGISSDGFVGLWSATSGNEEWRKEYPTTSSELAVWRPDGLQFAYRRNEYVMVEPVRNRSEANSFAIFFSGDHSARFLTWSPSGKYLAGFNDYDGVWAFDIDAQQKLPLENSPIYDFGVSHLFWIGDEQLNWSSHGDGGHDQQWSIPDGKMMRGLRYPCSYRGCAISLDAQFIAGANIYSVEAVEADTGTVLLSIDGYFFAPTWAPNNSQLTVVESDWRDHSIQAVVAFDPFASGELWRQDDIGFTADRLIWNETGTHLLAVGLGRVALLDGETGEILSRNENFREFSLAAPDSNAQHIAVADRFGDVLIIDINRGEKIDEVAGFTFPVSKLTWQPQGNTLAILNYLSSPGNSGRVQLWQSDANSASGAFNLPESSLDDLWAVDIAWNSDGSSLAVATSRLVSLFGIYQGTFDFIDPDDPLNDVHIYEVRWTEANEPVARYYKCCHQPLTLENAITGISSFVSERAWQLSPSGEIVTTGLGRTFAIENYPMTISIYRVSESGRNTLTLDDRTQYLAHHWISPRTTQVAAIDASGSGLIWDATTGQPLHFLVDVHDLVWTPDDSALAILRRDGSLWLQNADGLRLLWSPTIPIRAPGTVVWSGDGSTLAHVQDGVLRVWRP